MKKIYLILFAITIQSVNGQSKLEKWNVEKASGPTKSVSFSTDEGTWMNLDVSPDGKEIVFDLLGDIYKMPINGGKATILAGGSAFEVQPRFSPNGKIISYTSDKDGGDNIWVMNTDGSKKRSVTKETLQLLNNAAWTPDNQYLIARKNITGSGTLGAGEMWIYHFSGGEGLQLTKRRNDQKNVGESDVSPDGKYIYYSEDVSPGTSSQYNKDPNGEIYAIKRLNRESGKIENVAGGQGGAARPRISPDGKLMAFVKRVRLKSVLFIQDLDTGEEWAAYDGLSHDLQETSAVSGVYPNFAWTPDSKNIIFYAKGKIRSLDINTQESSVIPFELNVSHNVTEALHFNHQVFTEEFDAKMIRQLSTSPDGKKVAFNAAGYIYIKELPNGTPERLTNGTDFEFEPEFSPDGRSLIYVSWNDDKKGSIYKIDLKNKNITQLTQEKGFFYSPRFSFKGDKIVYRKGSGNNTLGFLFGKNAGIYLMSANGGTSTKISDRGIRPLFGNNDSRIYFQTKENEKVLFKSMDLNGSSVHTHYTSQYATQFVPSPDGKWLAFTEAFNAYITPLINNNSALDLSSSNKSLPLSRVTQDAGTSLHWSRDSKKLNWTLGSEYFSKDLKNAFTFVDGASAKSEDADSSAIALGLKLRADRPKRKMAFTNARIITMKGDEVIEKGTIVIDENKIISVGAADKIKVPDDAQIINSEGQTIMPGIIDVHAHLPTSPDGISPQQDWPYFANLAYGVTTLHDPSSNTEMAFSQAEMIKAGRMIGPRLFSTGTILYGTDGDLKSVVNSLEDARASLRRIKAIGALSVKSYNQPRREQRQQILQAARELKMEVVPEGYSTLSNNMSMILDGYTSIEHSIPVVPVYKDVKALWNSSKTSYTPTLIVSYGTQWGENFWYDRTNVWENERLLTFTPRSIIDQRARRRTTSEFGDYGHVDVSRVVKQLADGGTKINLGSQGRIQGLGAHWELWMLAQGGMSPLQAIRSATLNGAEYLGIAKELGSLETGKLADLVVLSENPLNDIRNSDKIKYVMINGRLYDAETMNEVGSDKSIGRFWWQTNKGESFGMSVSDTEMHFFNAHEGD